MNSKLNTLIENSDNIAIFTHVTPDADALGGAFAMKNIILNNYDMKNVDVFADGEIGELYGPIRREENLNPVPFDSYDLAIVLDCPNLQRTGGKYAELIACIPQIINIDHHATNTRFGTVNYVTPQVSSTCEMIYLIAKSHGFEIDSKIAKELYQGIITDTNNLTANSTKKTLQVICELLEHDFNAEKIKEYYFKRNSKAKTKLLARALQSLRFYDDDKLTTMKIGYETFNKLKATLEDTLGIIDNGINITGTEASAILIETSPTHIYCSLRSKGNVDVGQVASLFQGGGSINLAAFQIDGDIMDIERQLVDTITPLIPENSTDNEDFIF